MEASVSNSLFVVCTSHQQICDQQGHSSGVELTGNRNSRLRIGYRTSREVLYTAMSVLGNMPSTA